MATLELSLTPCSYDGEADDPAPPVKSEPVPATPELVEMPSEQQDASYKTEDTDDFKIQTEPDQGNDGMHAVQNGQQSHGDEYDRPIGIKEDGYV